MSLIETNSDTNDGDEELADQHAQGTPDKERSATDLLNGVEGDRGGANVDEGEDQGDQERVGDGAGRLQERGRVVEDEVDTSPLLHHLQRGSQDGTAQVGLLDPETASEAVNPGRPGTAVGDEGTLILLVGNDLRKLNLDILRVFGLSTESAESIGSIVESSALDKVTGRVWQEQQAATEDNTPGKLDTDGNTVGASIIAALGGVGNARGQQETDGDAELVTGNEGTADLSGALL